MKAKSLAKILLQNPEAEVVYYEYIGGPTILVEANSIKLEQAGEKTESFDGGSFIKDGIVQKNIAIIKYDSNKK